MKNDVLELLKKLEWSGHSLGMGSGPMGSGGDGCKIRCCPVCSGVDPSDSNAGDIHADWHGHREDCELNACLSLDVIDTRPGVDMSVPQLFVLRYSMATTSCMLAESIKSAKEVLDSFNTRHRLIAIPDEWGLDVIGDVTLEEIGLQRIPEDEDV